MLAIGGQTGTGATATTEILDLGPGEPAWRLSGSMHEPRKNLNVVLLPDGRVLSAGQTDGTMQTSAELYSPPYLFAGPRPVIDAAPSTVGYGSSFAVSTSQAASIDSVALVRANSSTHGVNFDQRHVPLSFSAGAGGLTVSAPASGAQAPPGWYMLFLINDAGVPSVASWVKVS